MPQVDFFACGFPCPSYSVQGARLGIEDLRGQLIFYVIRFIAIRRPHTFVLENVSNRYHQFSGSSRLAPGLAFGNTWAARWSTLPGQLADFELPEAWRSLPAKRAPEAIIAT